MLSEVSVPEWKSGGIRLGDLCEGFGWVDRNIPSSSRIEKVNCNSLSFIKMNLSID